jgi:thiol-disulfide isomerase/thioredoxin
MRKITLLIIGLLFLLSSYAQEVNKTIIDPDIDREILIGGTDEEGLQNPIFVEEWNLAKDEYTADKNTVKELKKYFRKHKNVQVKVFFASWCGDSKEHLPHFVKLVQKAKIRNVKYIALSRKKSLPGEDISDYNIEFVPTFIVYKDKEEIGRIIETPELSLEEDLLKIISK